MAGIKTQKKRIIRNSTAFNPCILPGEVAKGKKTMYNRTNKELARKIFESMKKKKSSK